MSLLEGVTNSMPAGVNLCLKAAVYETREDLMLKRLNLQVFSIFSGEKVVLLIAASVSSLDFSFCFLLTRTNHLLEVGDKYVVSIPRIEDRVKRLVFIQLCMMISLILKKVINPVFVKYLFCLII